LEHSLSASTSKEKEAAEDTVEKMNLPADKVKEAEENKQGKPKNLVKYELSII
jgi:hypothetical protein